MGWKMDRNVGLPTLHRKKSMFTCLMLHFVPYSRHILLGSLHCTHYAKKWLTKGRVRNSWISINGVQEWNFGSLLSWGNNVMSPLLAWGVLIKINVSDTKCSFDKAFQKLIKLCICTTELKSKVDLQQWTLGSGLSVNCHPPPHTHTHTHTQQTRKLWVKPLHLSHLLLDKYPTCKFFGN